MAKFFVKSGDIEGDLAYIRGNDAHHMMNVLRMKTGDSVELGLLGKSCEAEIVSFAGDSVCLKIVRDLPDNESDIRFHLLLGISKGEKMDWVIEKATELGVWTIIPVMLARCVVQLDEKSADKKRERWQRIAEAAAKQCRRSHIPEILQPCKLNKAILNLPENTGIIALWENENEAAYKTALRNTQSKDIALVIGAEGGIEVAEIELLRKNGAVTAGLGSRILRAETAAITALALASYELADLGGVK